MDINELLRSVHSLFSKVALLDLQKRTRSYKQQADSSRQTDIATSLTDYIDKMAALQPASKASVVKQGTNEPSPENITQESGQTEPVQAVPVNGVSTNLSEYMKSHSQHTSSDSYVGDKLKASTWSHIHTAILKAREGDAKAARLHADIANQALKEAGHYMDDEEFRLFSEEIEKALNELKQQSS